MRPQAYVNWFLRQSQKRRNIHIARGGGGEACHPYPHHLTGRTYNIRFPPSLPHQRKIATFVASTACFKSQCSYPYQRPQWFHYSTTRRWNGSNTHQVVVVQHPLQKDFDQNNIYNTAVTVRWLFVGGAGLATLSYVVHYFHDHFGGTEGLWRAAQFYSLAIPKYLEYRYHQYMQSPDYVWEKLDRDTSKIGLDIILRLKGFYIKCGRKLGVTEPNSTKFKSICACVCMCV